MTEISIRFTRYSAFYSPVILAMAAGLFQKQGLRAVYSVASPGESATDALLDGSAHVAQSALSQGLISLDQGRTPEVVHFAQINEKDGFFLTAREPDANFDWAKLRGRTVLVDHGGQPLAMFKYACFKMGLDYSAIRALDRGSEAAMDAAFRAGEGEYIHQQAPSPQQLERDGVGFAVASVGAAIGPCGFSSLAATRQWLGTDMASAFMHAYREARALLNTRSRHDLAARQAAYFPHTDIDVLAQAIGAYQDLGCWTPHAEITETAFTATQDIFLKVGRISRRFDYDQVCVAPPTGHPHG